jgi:hypothetical protein
MMPVVIAVGIGAFAQRDKVLDLYHAAYPGDPAKADALAFCAKDPNFNRLDSDDRAACYGKTADRVQAGAAVDPTPNNLSGNDIRRQQASLAYLEANRPSAVPADLSVVVPHPVVHPVLPHHVYRRRYAPPRSAAATPTIPQ